MVDVSLFFACRINPTRPARFQAQVLASSAGPIGYRWVCQNLNLTNPNIATTGQLSQYLAISPAFLEPGNSYTVIVYITDVYTGLVGTASYTIQVRFRPPVAFGPLLRGAKTGCQRKIVVSLTIFASIKILLILEGLQTRKEQTITGPVRATWPHLAAPRLVSPALHPSGRF